jgi:hypothetical protein
MTTCSLPSGPMTCSVMVEAYIPNAALLLDDEKISSEMSLTISDPIYQKRVS